MTKLKPVFIDPELKKILEFHKTIRGFKDVGSALIDLLNDSNKFNQTKKLYKLIDKPEERVTEIEQKEVDLNKIINI